MTTRYISMPGETVRRSAAAAPGRTAPKPTGRTAPRRRRRVEKAPPSLRALLLLAVLAAVAWGGLRLLDGPARGGRLGRARHRRERRDGCVDRPARAHRTAARRRSWTRRRLIRRNTSICSPATAKRWSLCWDIRRTMGTRRAVPHGNRWTPCHCCCNGICGGGTSPMGKKYGCGQRLCAGVPFHGSGLSDRRPDAHPLPRGAVRRGTGIRYVPGQGTSWSLLSEGAPLAGRQCRQLALDQGRSTLRWTRAIGDLLHAAGRFTTGRDTLLCCTAARMEGIRSGSGTAWSGTGRYSVL